MCVGLLPPITKNRVVQTNNDAGRLSELTYVLIQVN